MKFTRWAVLYRHDNSPVDKMIYTHKNEALKAMDLLKFKSSLHISKVLIECVN